MNLSVIRSEWCEKDLCAELGSCHPRTVKRWWRKLNVPPDKRRGGRGAMHLWTPGGAARLVEMWRAWWSQRGFSPELSSKKFTGALGDDPCQLSLFSWTPKIQLRKNLTKTAVKKTASKKAKRNLESSNPIRR